MSRRVLAGFRLFKDNGAYATDGVLTFAVANSSTPYAPFGDRLLSGPVTGATGAAVSLGSLGWAPDIWVADDVSVKVTWTGTGVTPKTIDYLTVADSTAAVATDSLPSFKNVLKNGAFNTWSGATSFSNVSGAGAAAALADAWYLSQGGTASNAASRQTADSVGAHYGLRVGRPNASTSTDQIRIYSTLNTDEAYRLRGQIVTLSFAAKAGANFSAASAALAILLVTGTSTAEDGNNISAGSWGGQATALSTTQALTTTLQRFEFSALLPSNLGEVGLQLSFAGVGTAGANDWYQIEDVQIELADAATDMEAAPEPLDFIRNALTTVGRTIVSVATAALQRAALGSTTVGDALFTIASAIAGFDTLNGKGADIASATTTDLSTTTGYFVNVTGTTTITGLGTLTAGRRRLVRFTGALLLTYDATAVILPGAANITTVAGDTAEFESLGAGNWRCLCYTRISGLAPVSKPPTRQVITSTSTYTPPAGMTAADVEIVAGGGSGGGTATPGAAALADAGGGGGGGYSKRRLSAAQIGASQSVTIGAAGAAPSAGANNGNSGGTTSFGALLSATGGGGGNGCTAAAGVGVVGGAGGIGSSGDLNLAGNPGGNSYGTNGVTHWSGFGGGSFFGGGGVAVAAGANTEVAGVAGRGYGGGGSGSSSSANGAQQAGGAGAPGVCVVTEFYD